VKNLKFNHQVLGKNLKGNVVLRKKQETTMTNHSVEKLLSQKRLAEQACKQKNWLWPTTIRENNLLESIDSKLLKIGYYDSNSN